MTSGASGSDLSNQRYGYDVVCAVTQSSVDATVKQYLGTTKFPATRQVYIADGTGHSKAITWTEFLVASRGADPFAIPATANPNDPKDPYAGSFANLASARFLFGFNCQMGLPTGVPPYTLSVIGLNAESNTVDYSMYCSVFECVLFEPAGGYSSNATWTSVSQPSGAPWVFTSKVDLNFEEMKDFTKLPVRTQQAINNAGGAMALSVQQLVFDLEHAVLNTLPTMTGVSNYVKGHLQDTFLGIYFDQMKAAGQPLLYVSATTKQKDASDFRPTSLEREVCKYNGTATPKELKDLTTLNYLCASFGKKLPPPVPITWDWVKAAPKQTVDGVLAINRNTFASWLGDLLMPIAIKNSFAPWTDANYNFFSTPHVHLQAALLHSGPTNKIPPPQPTQTITTSGSKVLTIKYGKKKESTCPSGDIKLEPAYEVEVTFAGSTITIFQRLSCYLAVHVYSSSLDGNIVDYQVTDTYNLGVADGKLVTTLTGGNVEDHSQSPSTNWFLEAFTDLNSIRRQVQSQAKMESFDFGSVPAATMQNFIFPGANVFSFSNVQFSDNQDLTANIVYLDPSQNQG